MVSEFSKRTAYLASAALVAGTVVVGGASAASANAIGGVPDDRAASYRVSDTALIGV